VNEEVALPTRSASYIESVLFRYSVRYGTVRLAPASFLDQALLTSTSCWLIKTADRSEWRSFCCSQSGSGALLNTYSTVITALREGTVRCQQLRHPEWCCGERRVVTWGKTTMSAIPRMLYR
jgi:hypothetical protein